MRRPLFFLLFLLSLGLGVYFNSLSRLREVYRSVCDLTEEHFYREDEQLERWLKECHKRAARFPAKGKVDDLVGDIQDLMSLMKISHFQIYNPIEDKRMWKGESIDTGIRSRYVEDHLVVYKVLPGSGAEAAGVRAGDDILAISGAEQITPWGAMRRSGRFTLRRTGRQLTVDIISKDLVADATPKFQRLSATTAVVELPSFRSDFFDHEAWRRFAAQFAGYQNLILDLRENSGGNFVAMLRALSTFQCGGRRIGVLEQPRRQGPAKPAFDNNTSDDYQIRELDKFRSLGLQTFSDYGCYVGRVTVLVGPETSSTAEIFANSFFARKNSRVWGQPTAGDVVLAVWFDLPALGPGFSISIPEAVYLTPEKKELEGQGVWPQRELYYDLKEALLGKDSWIEASLR
jgi:carboxyl-terminal processing protease